MKTPCLLLWKKDNNIRPIVNKKWLYTCFSPELKKYSNSIIIDSDQNVFHIKNVEKIGWGTWLFGINLLYKHRIFKIKYNISYTARTDMAEIKSIIIEKVERKPAGRFMLEYFGSIEKLRARVLAAEDIGAVIKIFLEDD